MTSQKKFRFRAFVSVLTGFSFILLAITGIILFITPPGRIANWTNWTIWGLSKHQWGALHICLCVLCMITSVLHIWLNRKPLFSYFAVKLKQAAGLRIEWIAAAAVCIVVITGALMPFTPFSNLLSLNNRIKNSWAAPKEVPPIPHAEILTITELAQKADLDVDTLLNNLSSKGIEVNPGDIFGDIANTRNLSPNQLFNIATGQSAPSVSTGHGGGRGQGGGSGGGQGGGFGRKTLNLTCTEMDIDIENTVCTLKDAGIECTPDQQIREIADNNNIHPSRIRQTLESLATE